MGVLATLLILVMMGDFGTTAEVACSEVVEGGFLRVGCVRGRWKRVGAMPKVVGGL